MLEIVIQPEIAYLKRNRQVVDVTDPPDGYLFVPHRQRIPENATQEQIFKFLAMFMVKLGEDD